MSHRSCCVVDCTNTSRKSQCKFYKFPTAKWKINQREKWIVAVKRLNADGSPWIPKPYDYICSDHFVGGQKSEVESSPSFAPTIFPLIYKSRKIHESSAVNRFKRFMNRRLVKTSQSKITPEYIITEPVQEMTEIPPAMVTEHKIDQECQVNFYSESDVKSQTFTCNRFIKNGTCHAETQTEILEGNIRSKKINIRIRKNYAAIKDLSNTK